MLAPREQLVAAKEACLRAEESTEHRLVQERAEKVQSALAAYWLASDPEQERVAYARMMALGLPDSYATESDAA